MIEILQNTVFLISAFLFTLGIKKLGSPKTARQGNLLSSVGMGLAVVVSLIDLNVLGLQIVFASLVIGSVIGAILAIKIKMTAMPEMVALLNGLGGGASLLLALAAYAIESTMSAGASIIFAVSVLIGGVTLTGSVIAWAKLAEKIPGKPVSFLGQQALNLVLLLTMVIATVMFINGAIGSMIPISIIVVIALILGVLSVNAIGGGDMPVVIALLNSYSGLAACAAGFVVNNLLLIVTGLLVGASGLILTNIMCKSMNRSLKNVLFGGFGGTAIKASATGEKLEVNPIISEDAYLILEAARSVVVVPGYGMAVAQAQHSVRELGEMLEENGCDVKYAIHPVAGRMPGHMNVLLAEANVSYDALIEMDDINKNMNDIDVCLVIGANDVVNPDALDNKASPIYGMPIIEVDKAKTVFVLKRSMKPGFAGIENPLFFKENTRMLFGDAKESLTNIVSEFST